MAEDGIEVFPVPAELNWIWSAWHRLQADRTWVAGGMGPARPLRLSWQLVMAWAASQGLDDADTELLEAGFAVMDAEFLRHHAAAVKRTMERTRR